MGKTLKELNVKPGDVVYFHNPAHPRRPDMIVGKIVNGIVYNVSGDVLAQGYPHWHRVSRAAPTLWKDITAEEKGALLMAWHNCGEVEYWSTWWGAWKPLCDAVFRNDTAYRVRPEPTVERVLRAQYFRDDYGWYEIWFNLIDGEPDCSSVKMEKVPK